ncbi:endonuclease/exonuclease/phosphatase family protein [Rhizobium sp. RU36D]|uniref:endonuclease/exonuclease/phosphatase family protein n=1 Tax=Rhizobium sp. RU36D TaxID=1907415 RepID=UPI0009D84464|nr:endonuclease/exonuclease/phosphatase family protein [Rhizobium sp. RU36D]SMD17122.1 Metal-dependent hydrolase, endonuclease/exonuclease/phosphatase family [Rhizobium sp. RU36D]
MRLAVYNVENLFDRAKAMNLDTWEDGRPVLEKFAALNALLGQVTYSDSDRQRMAQLAVELGLEKSDLGPFVILRRNRGGLLKRPEAGGIVFTATGRADWVGSLELRDAPINEHAMRNTARVIKDIGADILGVVEAESRPVLAEFNSDILPAVGGTPFRHVMLIDGNDERGIDVGLMSGPDFPIGRMRSHVDDRQRDNRERAVFSRDCPEFEITTGNGAKLLVMVNHFKSKGFGSTAESDKRRRLQAERVVELCAERLAEGWDYIAVIGDLNDTPASAPLKALVQDSPMKDVFGHQAFDNGGYEGTYGLSNPGNKIDYMLLSPALMKKVVAGGVIRTGMWPGSRPKRWETYAELKRPQDAASDHAALWVDLDI